MFYQLKSSFMLWAYQVKHHLLDGVLDLNPQEYCVLATFIISIGFVLLSGRR